MKKLSFAIITFSLIAFFGCSQLKNENPAAPAQSVGVHPEGFASPASPNFHGTSIAAHSGDTKECTKCHGADYNGGTSGKSCNACHKHPDGVLTPSSANWHGKMVAANNWSMAKCKTCHGTTYSGGMSGKSCLTCHTKSNGPENCTTCHGSSTSAAPPQDLSGNTSPTARAVGAHQTHLAAAGTGAGMKCSNCHSVPSSLGAPGHIDATQYAEVRFDTTANLAFTKSNVAGTSNYTSSMPTIVPNPSYSSATVKCSNTYCHGNFKNGNTTNAPTWNDTTAAACGTCHGDKTKATLLDRALPGGTHIQFNGCSNCHSGVIDASGKLLDPSKHVNGKLSVFGTEQNF